MRTVSLPERPLTVAYEEQGEGPTLVFVHGFPLCRWMWEPQLKALSATHRVLAPDLPGFGSTDAVLNLGIDDMADIVCEFLDAAQINGPVVLAGLSMGGYVALAFARRYPNRLRGLILADTKSEADDSTAKQNRDKQIAGLRDGSITPDSLIETMMPKLLAEGTRNNQPHTVAEVRRIGSAQPKEGILAGVVALRDRPDATSGLAKIAVPTLVIVGEHDAITPPEGAHKMASAIPGARIVTIPDAGHMPNLEQPERFNAAVQEFLNDLATS